MNIKLLCLTVIFFVLTLLTTSPVHLQKVDPKQNQQIQKKQIANADAPRFALMVGINKYKFGKFAVVVTDNKPNK